MEFFLSKRAKIIEPEFNLSKRAAPVSSAQKTAQSLYKIIQFLFYRVPDKHKQKFLSRLKGKIIKLNPSNIGMKKLQPSNALGQSIALAKGLLSGLNPIFINLVLSELARLLTTNTSYIPPVPPEAKRGK